LGVHSHVLGEVKENVLVAGAEVVEPRGVLLEEIAHLYWRHLLVVRFERIPGRRVAHGSDGVGLEIGAMFRSEEVRKTTGITH
jgi:hypothetical protein